MDDLGIAWGDVGGLARILFQIDEERFVEPDAVGGRDVSVEAEGRSADGLGCAREVKFPLTLPHGLKMNTKVVVKGLVGISHLELAMKEVADIFTVDDAVLRRFRAGQCGKGREQV